MSVHAIGGLTDVGFSDDDHYLLVVGHQGRGVFDCTTGERVARQSEPEGCYPDEATGSAEGIGPLEGQRLPMSGLMSGRALPETHGNWRVEVTGVGVRLTDGSQRHDFLNAEEPRACGFGNHGRVAVLATSSDVSLLVLDSD